MEPENQPDPQVTKTTTIQMDTERLGYNFAKGACDYLFSPIPWVILAIVPFTLIRSHFSWGLDDSDADGWNRSGLKVHTDHKTGIEYLSDGQGGLTPRLPKPLNLTSPEK